jgi:xylose dehydrogenase (NAD/NADP)
MAEPLRWGILGTGGIAHKFADQLPQANRGILAAVGSRSAESARRFAQPLAATAHGSYDALLADPNVDAVYVSLPNALHCEWSVRALESGKHVLCEKPIASSAAEAEQMFAVAERTGRVLIEAFMYRCHPAVRQVIQSVRDGQLGKLKLIRTHFTFNRPDDPADVRYQPRMAGGSLMDVGCYCINFARALVGTEPVEANVLAHRHPTGVDDYAAGTLRFDGDVLCAFTCGMTVEADRTTSICGSDGFIAIDMPWLTDGSFSVGTLQQRRTIRVQASQGPYALEADAMAAVVQDGEPPFVSRDDSLGNMRVLDKLRRQMGIPCE